MRMQRNFYEVLGVSRTATPYEIKQKYHSLARQYHPDRATDKELAQRLFVQINRAYGTLMNEQKRALYDAGLSVETAAPSAPASPSVRNTPLPPRPPVQPAPPSRNDIPRPQQAAAANNGFAARQTVSPEQIRSWLEEAVSAQMRGNVDRSITLCHQILAADPHNYPGLVLIGDLHAVQGRMQDALTAYRQAAVIQPSNRLLREKLARTEAMIEQKRAASAAQASRPTPAPAPSMSTASRATQPAQSAQPKQSIFDRLMNRSK